MPPCRTSFFRHPEEKTLFLQAGEASNLRSNLRTHDLDPKEQFHTAWWRGACRGHRRRRSRPPAPPPRGPCCAAASIP